MYSLPIYMTWEKLTSKVLSRYRDVKGLLKHIPLLLYIPAE